MFVVFPALARRLTLALVASALAALSGPAASLGQPATQDSPVASEARAKPCRPKGSTTVKKSRLARIYELGSIGNVPDFYGCLYSRNKSYVIGERGYCDVGRVGNFRLAGRYEAYTIPFCDIDILTEQVRVVDLETGQQLVATSSSPSLNLIVGIGRVYVTDMELKANGSIAWIVKLKGGPPTQEEVRKSDRKLGKGKRETSGLLDAGQQIASRSLTRDGSTISWTNAGVEKTATLR